MTKKIAKSAAKRKAAKKMAAKGASRFVPGVGQMVMMAEGAPVAVEGLRRVGQAGWESSGRLVGHNLRAGEALRAGRYREFIEHTGRGGAESARGAYTMGSEFAKGAARTALAAALAREAAEATYELERKGKARKKRKAKKARKNPDVAYTILVEHRSGSRGKTYGLPGSSEYSIHRYKDHTGRYEPKQMTRARAGQWLLQATRGSGSGAGVLVLDASGHEVDPEELVADYRIVTGKGYKVRGNPRSRKNPSGQDIVLYQNILGTLRAMQWLAWTSHWTASGPSFYGDHELLQRLYEGINEPIDELGERMVTYFGPKSVDPVEIQVISAEKLSGLQRFPKLRALLLLEGELQESLKAAWEANQKAGDQMSLGIDDWLMSLANKRDTAIYLLRQRTSGVSRPNPRRRARPNPVRIQIGEKTYIVRGTQHFETRVETRGKELSKRRTKKFLELYRILASGKARTTGLHGRYAIQFGGEPGSRGDYVVIDIVGGEVAGFITLLVEQFVPHTARPPTMIIPASRVLP